MRLVGMEILEEFSRTHVDVAAQIAAWRCEVEDAEWKTPSDIKARYSNASFLSGNRVVFNLKGNNYRLLVQVSYKNELVLAMKIGTHAEYSKWKL